MKKRISYRLAVLIGIAAISTPALALRVTNLDNVPHTVVYTASGSAHEATVAPGESTQITGLADGFLSLKTEHPKPSKGTLHSDGLLSGVVGAERDQDIPATYDDEFAIWPGGELLLQSSRKDRWKY